MASLETQYKNYLEQNPDRRYTYNEWLDWHSYNIKHSLLKFNMKLEWIATQLRDTAKNVQYEGDMSDLGNEIGHAVGLCIEGMTDEQIKDFIQGIRHGISLTNGTHGK